MSDPFAELGLPRPPRTTPDRLVYLGTPDLAVPPLVALHDAGFEIALVVSQPDKRRGRGGATTPSPVKAAALDLGLAVTDQLHDATTVGADLGVVVAYGRIIPNDVLAELPMINIHFSMLPRWRGAAPVERAILAGDATTGVCLMTLAPELDTGDLHRCAPVDIGDDETLDELRGRLVALGSKLLVEELQTGLSAPEPQVGDVTHAEKIQPGEHRLDFSRPAVQLHRIVRLGRAWCEFRGRRLKVVESRLGGPDPAPDGSPPSPGDLRDRFVATGDGWLELVTVQPEGKRPMAVDAWLNGAQPQPGECLG